MQNFLVHHGYYALVLFAIIEAACIPIPSEITFSFAGVLAATGKLNLAAVIVLGTLGEVVGSFIAYSVGRVGGRPLVERVGRYLLVTRRDLDRAEAWFNGRGEFAVAVGRAMPILRAFVSLAAGIGDMGAVRFVIFSALGTVIYASALAGAGYAVGQNWHHVVHAFSVAGYIVAGLVVLAIVAFLYHRLQEVRRERAQAVSGDL